MKNKIDYMKDMINYNENEGENGSKYTKYKICLSIMMVMYN